MYFDKPLKEHGLLQAIARTNRTCSLKRPDGAEIEKPHGRIVDYIGVTNHLDEALASYRAEDVQNALRDIAILRSDLREAHARYARQKRLLGLDGMDEKAAAYAVGKLVTEGREDDWFDLQRLARNFVRVYGDLSPDPAILDFTAGVKWAAAFLRLATQVISKDESLDHRSYTGKIRDMLEEHVQVISGGHFRRTGKPGRVPVVGRFALAGGMPFQTDAPATVRSMALRFPLPGGEEWRTGMNNIPVFVVNSARGFYEQLFASSPDPATGKPDPSRMNAFLAAHPETVRAMQLIKKRQVTSGFANSTFNSRQSLRPLRLQPQLYSLLRLPRER
jgi:hypothetical protein